MTLAGTVAILLCLATGAWAQTPAPVLRMPRVSRPPSLDDFLRGRPREAEARVTGFRQRYPRDGAPASRETTAYVSYDERNLYVAFDCRDEPGKIRGRLAKREDVGDDDSVAVFLDTFHDRQRAYMFAANPLGIQSDAIYTEGQGNDTSFDTLWYSEGRVTKDGYIVWMAIPFKSLRFSSSARQTWGIALNRTIFHASEDAYWPFISQKVEGLVPHFATLEGLDDVSPGRNLQFIPYGVFSRARLLDTAGPKPPGFYTSNEGRVGLDAKVVLRDALTLDVAANPDFSQVESDEPQVTVNQRYEVYYPERRPLFIENAGFFQTPMELFFSRRIQDPRLGARLTGKLGRWALGALGADDRAAGRRVPQNDPLHGRSAAIGVVRVQREFARQSSVGVLMTSRDFGSMSSRVLALDTRLKLNPNWVLSGQAARTYDRQPGGRGLSGPLYYADLTHSGKHFDYSTTYIDRSPDVRAPLGFINRVDMRRVANWTSYTFRPEHSRVLAWRVNVAGFADWNRSGRLQDWNASAGTMGSFRGNTRLFLTRSKGFELFKGAGFQKEYTNLYFTTARWKWLVIDAPAVFGTAINYYPAGGRPPFSAKFAEMQAGLTVRPAPKLRLQQAYVYSRLATQADAGRLGLPASTPIYNNHILRAKVNYQFTRELSLRVILDYNAVLPNSSLINQERSKRLAADLLVTYLVHPGTVVYAGYTEARENLALVGSAPPALVRTASPGVSTGRQFFVKVSYLFRF